MLKLAFGPASQKTIRNVQDLQKKFPSYLKKVQRFPFTQLPWSDPLKSDHKKSVSHVSSSINVIGIGGSSLGLKTIARAHGTDRYIDFYDNVDPSRVSCLVEDAHRSLDFYFFISKSGETLEVLSLARALMPKIKKSKQMFVITDNPASSLGKLARKFKIPIATSPHNIPGRFSALSLSTLLPAYAAGADVDDLRNGARGVSFEDAFLLAAHQYLHYKDKKNIAVLFPYSERLKTFGEWFSQLLAESVGKSQKTGITPMTAMGVTDQHSLLQLFLDGPDDKFYTFIKPDTHTYQDQKIPGKKYGFEKLFSAEYLGVKQTFAKRKKPFAEISFPFLNAETLGELFFFFELEVAFLGLLFGVNFENQPAVEFSKKMTHHILGSPQTRVVRNKQQH